jgi:hypothetical protein
MSRICNLDVMPDRKRMNRMPHAEGAKGAAKSREGKETSRNRRNEPLSPRFAAGIFSGSLNTHFKEQFRRGGQPLSVAYSNVLSRKKQGGAYELSPSSRFKVQGSKLV